MTEFGDRIKAYRTKNNLTQPEACNRLFPQAHGHSSPNAKAVYISGLESGRSTLSESAPDFQNVMRLLGMDEAAMLKMLHADHRAMRRAARAPAAVGGTIGADVAPAPLPTEIASAAKALDAKLSEIASLTNHVKKTPSARASVSNFDPETNEVLRRMAEQHGRLVERQHVLNNRPSKTKGKTKAAPPANGSSDHAKSAGSNGFDALVADLSYVIQRRSPGLQETHHQTLSDFTRRVAVAASVVGTDLPGDVGALAEDLCHVMQQRSQSQQIRALPTKPLRDFVRRVVTSAVRLQEVQ